MKISQEAECIWEMIVEWGEKQSKENRARTVITFNSESPNFGRTAFYLSTYGKTDKYGEEWPDKRRYVITVEYLIQEQEIDEIITRWSEYTRQ